MTNRQDKHELYHEIFGSILDRHEMVPYLLLRASNYRTALRQVTKMLGNRGFDTRSAHELRPSEKRRAHAYVARAIAYLHGWLFRFLEGQLTALLPFAARNRALYEQALASLVHLRALLETPKLCSLIEEDPRHVFLLAASQRYPLLFASRADVPRPIPPDWQKIACAILKLAHLIKSIEEDSQDVHDHAQLGMFLESHGVPLDDIHRFRWDHPGLIPPDEPAQTAFVELSTFFHKLSASMTPNPRRAGLVFNSGDGVEVDILDVKSRLKSPESMFAKLGRDSEGEAHDIRDILAITFILKDKNDTLKLFHAMQKQGVILQENVVSHSITQTLFDSPALMTEAVRRLVVSLGHSEGKRWRPTRARLLEHARQFFEALSVNARLNEHSSREHRKFQCKINFSVPIHRNARTHKILVPGTDAYARRDEIRKTTQQHTLAVELRISDANSWLAAERTGDSHHDAYKFRQAVALTARLFGSLFRFPRSAVPELRKDQGLLFRLEHDREN